MEAFIKSACMISCKYAVAVKMNIQRSDWEDEYIVR